MLDLEYICFDCHRSVGLLDILAEDMIYLLQLADIHCMMGHLDFWYNQLVGEDSFLYLDHMVPCKKDRLDFWYNQVYMTDHLALFCSQLVVVAHKKDH